MRQSGFTLIETVIAVAVVAAFALTMIPTLAGRPGSQAASFTNVTRFFAVAAAVARTNGAPGSAGGVTIEVRYDPAPDDATTLRLVLGRPVPGGMPDAPANLAPLRVNGRLSLATSTPADAGSFAIFMSPAGATSMLAGATAASTDEPSCDLTMGVRMSFATASQSAPISLDCVTGQILPTTPGDAKAAST